VDFENLVSSDVSQHLNRATWPANLYLIDLFQLAGSEVDAL
jgi:hypothetical protein